MKNHKGGKMVEEKIETKEEQIEIPKGFYVTEISTSFQKVIVCGCTP